MAFQGENFSFEYRIDNLASMISTVGLRKLRVNELCNFVLWVCVF